jgi:hypothetical protein
MKELIIEPTKTTFFVNFDFSNGIIRFSGNSFPENAIEFFQPLIDKLKLSLRNYKKPLKVIFQVNYFNTSSSKYLFKIMEVLEQHQNKGNEVEVIWHFVEGEEDMLETWSELIGELDLEFKIVEG